jgi:hypothetical protein
MPRTQVLPEALDAPGYRQDWLPALKAWVARGGARAPSGAQPVPRAAAPLVGAAVAATAALAVVLLRARSGARRAAVRGQLLAGAAEPGAARQLGGPGGAPAAGALSSA